MNIVETREIVLPRRRSPGLDARALAFYRDLLRPFGQSVDETRLNAGNGYDHVEIAGALIEPGFTYRPDLIVVAQALPDLLPFKVVAPWLDHRLGGSARCLGISQAGAQAPFLALRTVAAYRQAAASSLALIVVLEQSTLPAAHPVADGRELVDSGVALVVSDSSGWEVTQLVTLADAQDIGAAIDAQRGEQGETAAILGPLITVDVSGVEILRAERRHYATAVWRRFAVAAQGLRRAFQTVVLADADPVTGAGFVVRLQRVDSTRPGGDA